MNKKKLMKYIIFLFFFALLTLEAQASVDLLEAKNTKLVTVAIKSLGGYHGECISITTKNISGRPQQISVAPGTIFSCKNDKMQDLMVVREEYFVLNVGQQTTLSLSTVCIKQHNMAPSKEDLFVMNSKATGSLKSIAELISKNKFQNSTAQASVWAITDGNPITDIYAMDTVMAKELATFVAENTEMPIPTVFYQKEHYIYSIKMNLVHHFLEDKKVTLTFCDSVGTVLYEFYKDRLIPKGVFISYYGANRVADMGTKFIYRLTDEKGNILKERSISESINEAKADIWKLDFNLNYVIKNPIASGTLSLYDDKGEVLENIYQNRAITAGGKNIKYSFHHAQGQRSTFYLKLKDKEGALIFEEKIDGAKSTKGI